MYLHALLVLIRSETTKSNLVETVHLPDYSLSVWFFLFYFLEKLKMFFMDREREMVLISLKQNQVHVLVSPPKEEELCSF